MTDTTAVETSDAITATADVEAGDEVTTTADLTDTTAVETSDAITATEDADAGDEVTATTELTETTAVTAENAITATDGGAVGEAITGTMSMTDTTMMTATDVLTAPVQGEDGSCRELLESGDFETTTGWRFGNSRFRAVQVSDPVHGGTYALQLGLPTTVPNRYAHSSALQAVTLPNAATITLTYWERAEGSSDGADYREVLLLDNGFGLLASLQNDRTAGAGEWVQRTIDLSPYRGESGYLYFNVYNNGYDAKFWSYLDDIKLQGCDN